ncbi:MAG: cyclic pyranopterin monophosphate synthase MoaC [Planctomycetota bacterium]
MASTHFNSDGDARMVDVTGKPSTKRTATASAQVRMNALAMQTLRDGTAGKGDVLAVARIAAISATKLTPQMIPLCHAVPIEAVRVDFEFEATSENTTVLVCRVVCETTYKTGIEMEAMTGVSVAALTIYDMLKSVDRAIVLGPIQLEQKSGGMSGDYQVPSDQLSSD